MAPRGRLVLRAALDALALAGRALTRAALATTLTVLTVLAALAWGAAPAAAATPPSGTLTDAGGPVSYTAGPFFVSNASAQANGTPICNTALQCDQFALTVTLSPAVAAANKVKIQIQWPLSTADFDLYVFDSSNTLVGQSATSNDPETVILPAVNGAYTVLVAPFDPAGQSFTGTISLVPIPVAPPPPPGIAPRYQSYAAPAGIAESSGEPSISIDWNPNNGALRHGTVNTGGVDFFTANENELRVSFDDCSSPAHSLWEDVTSPTEGVTTLDPIGFGDHVTGRIYQCQLSGGQSRIAFSDDDGGTWTQGQGGPADQGPDHETLGGGPFAAGAPPHPLYPRAVYYCSQNVAGGAECGLSLDGGRTYLPGVDIFTVTQCTGGIHGHVKVAPDDGTVYVPNSSCATGGGTQGVAVSRDNGVTWTDFTVPGSSGSGDPSVGIGANGTIYLGWQNGDGHPHIAVSHDHGQTWQNNTDAGAALGIQNSVFPVVVAGDDNRAAFGFLGTPTGGNYQDTTNFHGIWHFYVATTFDGGNSWYLVDATPDDPVQVGSICTGGTTCGPDRNLLDFNDITIDQEGRVVAAFADGCVAPGCNAGSPSSSSRSAKGTVLRQSGGRRLLAAFDPPEPARPPAPLLLAAVRQAGAVTVTWEVPDNGGTPLTGYKVYRGTASGGETLLATIGPGKPAYLDTTADPNTKYFYRVTAFNAQGEGPFCGEVSVVAGNVQSACVLPGITVITDPSGDQTGAPANSELDILSVSLAEPWLSSCSNQLVFTMKVNDLSVVPPQAQWTIFFSRANGTEYFVAMVSNGTGNPTGVQFVYGHTSTGTGGVRQLTTDGTADAGSGFTSDGTITIVLSLAKLTFNLNPPPPTLPPPAPGDTFGNINALTQQTVGVLLLTIDSTASAGYTLAGNQACEPSVPPVAQLVATPNGGPAPLGVMFDGSGSTEPDLCDTITSYTFDFGDGSPPVTQAAPTITHQYVLDGEFPARLRVTDSRGTASANTAQQLISVEGGTPLCGGGGGGLCYYTLTPCRAFDSRSGSPLASGTQVAIQAGGTCGVPMSARAVSVNITVVGSTGNGYLSIYPDAMGGPPTTSTIVFTSGQTRANNAVSGLAAGGQGTFIVRPSVGGGATVNVVVDVNGYFQ
ncbi:MAG TPA: PKD domain-containing protein [Thermoanaerobaculia bacterium]|jgi:hypothetical protein|nr:PKD domain-containing protein [Thermoanaerobaculia bacterium]